MCVICKKIKDPSVPRLTFRVVVSHLYFNTRSKPQSPNIHLHTIIRFHARFHDGQARLTSARSSLADSLFHSSILPLEERLWGLFRSALGLNDKARKSSFVTRFIRGGQTLLFNCSVTRAPLRLIPPLRITKNFSSTELHGRSAGNEESFSAFHSCCSVPFSTNAKACLIPSFFSF